MISSLFQLLLLLCFCSHFLSAKIITHLPGFSGPLPFYLETGYVGVDELNGVQLFYYFIESEGNPREDPVLLWLTGGPGCSALSGLIFEIGPLNFKKEKYNGSLPNLDYNPYSWTKTSNVIFLDSPVGTGFSFSRHSEGYQVGDITSSRQVHTFLLKWFIEHPQYLANHLYISGDSYAGKVVPVIAEEISKGIKVGYQPSLNLKGYLIGNPVTGEKKFDTDARIPYLHGFGIISDELFELANKCYEEHDQQSSNITNCENILDIVQEFYDLYRAVRDSQLIGLSGYSKGGLPVYALGVGLSTYDKASVHYYLQSHIQINEYRDRVVLPAASLKQGRHIGSCVKILDMSGLKLTAMSQLKLLTKISTVDDLNYPEKTETYYVVNAPYIFSACWKAVRPLLQERTRRKVQVLSGCGKDELLKIMDYASLPHFCKREGSGSSRYSSPGTDNCFSLDHPFHQQLYNFIKRQSLTHMTVAPIKQGSFHVTVSETDDGKRAKIAQTIESEFHKIGDRDRLTHSMNGLHINIE